MRFPVRRLMAARVVACLCGLACLVGVGVTPGVAAAAQLGATQLGESGSGAGQFTDPTGVAVDNDPASLFDGDVYVADYTNNRVDRFSGTGSFQLAWGWGVANGANELQSCTASCQRGKSEEEGQHFNTGATASASGVAVDSDPLSVSAGDVYVVEAALGRVEKFGPSGEFLLMFGGDVNETTGGDVCDAGEKCQRGTDGSADGQFEELTGSGSSIAVGPGGRVYVGDRARVQVFEPTGVWHETISLSGLSSTGTVTALAVDAAGSVFVKDSGAAGVREFESDGVEKSTQFDVGSTSVTAVTVDGSGDVFVGDSSGGEHYVHVLKYKSATGNAVGAFGFKTVRMQSQGMAFSEDLDDVYVSESYDQGVSYHVWALPVPPPGPSVESESTTPAPPGGMVLEGSLNPEGNETEYHFEYVDEAGFKVSGFSHAVSTPAGLVVASLEDQSVRAHVTGLPPGGIYYYRLVASNSESISPTIGAEETFESLPAASLGGEYVTNVTSGSATIGVLVNSLGSSTEYSIEYGLSTAYEHILTGSAGDGTTEELVSRHLQELAAGATYHYRVVLHNALGTVEGPDQTFMMQVVGGSDVLADERQWELVSPADKHGALIELPELGGLVQAASDGSGITYLVDGGDPTGTAVGKLEYSQILSRRGPAGWSSGDLTLPERLPGNGEPAEQLFHIYPEYHLFSPDLSSAAVEPQWFGTPPLAPGVTGRTLYLRDNLNGSFTPMVDSGNVPEGTRIEEPDFYLSSASDWELHFLAATPDLSHVVFKTPLALTPEAPDEETAKGNFENGAYKFELVQWNLYEWSNGALQLVNILPDGEAAHGLTDGEVAHGPAPLYPPVRLAGVQSSGGLPRAGVARAISADGRRIAWTWGGLYVRDMVEEKTVKVGKNADYQMMNSSGSKIFYLENGDLYVYDFETGTETDLTAAHGAGEPNAGVQQLVSDVSEDGSYVYFVATGVLADGGVSGRDNLYVLHDTAEGWTTSLVAVLSTEDEPDWTSQQTNYAPFLPHITSRVSPDGRFLAFMSKEPLTGYDNQDVDEQPTEEEEKKGVSAQAKVKRFDEEVFLYDAGSGSHPPTLVCASCDPTGARPEGLHDQAESLIDRTGGWTDTEVGKLDSWLAGNVPGWDNIGYEPTTYQPRYLSDSGRLFFDSPVGLVPRDTNGLEDVYEYEPEGLGNCTSATSSAVDVYVKEVAGRPVGGCVGLISSGTSRTESAFYDASEDGDDVFFDTTGRLVSEDYDTAYDLYDAHVCSSAVPCRTAGVPPPPCDSGDSCKAAPSPQTAIFGAPASATFNGAGNVALATVPTQVTKKTTKCAKGKKLSRGRCVKSKARRKRAKRVGHKRRAKS